MNVLSWESQDGDHALCGSTRLFRRDAVGSGHMSCVNLTLRCCPRILHFMKYAETPSPPFLHIRRQMLAHHLEGMVVDVSINVKLRK